MRGDENMDADSRVKLAEIGGDIKLIRQSQEQYGKDVDRLSIAQEGFQRSTNERLNNHSTRLADIGTQLTMQSGVRQGVDKTLRTLWLLGGGSGGLIIGVIAAIVARAQGV